MTTHDRWLLDGIEEDDPDFPEIEQRVESMYLDGETLVELAMDWPDNLAALFADLVSKPETGALVGKHFGDLLWAEATRQVEKDKRNYDY